MADLATSWVQTHPSFMEPQLLLQYSQASGAFETLATGNPLVKLGTEDKYVYIRSLDIRTRMSAGQSGSNFLPSVALTPGYGSIATYLQQVRAEYNHHQTAAMAQWNISIVEAQRLGMRQGHFQLLRNSLLFGMMPSNGEGLANTNGATSMSLPPDSNNNTTVVTYDNGQMATFFLTQFSATKTRTMQLGMPRKFVILGPQRTLGAFEYQNIVSLIQFQKEGGGTTSTAGLIKNVAEKWNGDEVIWAYDDTLQGAGAGGNDLVMIIMPEVEKPRGGKFNTNEFASLGNGIAACTLQYTDMAAPVEIPSPLPGGAVDILSELRATPGWGVRPEAITLISMQYQ